MVAFYLAPHFDLPFRFVKGAAVVVEQDSYEDVANCAEAIIRYPVGSRVYDDRIEYGIPMPEFDLIPLDVETLAEIVQSQEPRVQILANEEKDMLDTHIDHLRLEIWPTSGSQ